MHATLHDTTESATAHAFNHTLMRRCVCLCGDGSLVVLVDGPFVKSTGQRKKIYEGKKNFWKNIMDLAKF